MSELEWDAVPDDKFTPFLNWLYTSASEIVKAKQDVAPMVFCFPKATSKIGVLAVPVAEWQVNDDSKERIAYLLRRSVQPPCPFRIAAYVSEVWLWTAPADMPAEEVTAVRPSLRPDRREAVAFTVLDEQYQAYAVAHFLLDPRRLGPLKRIPIQSLAGRFVRGREDYEKDFNDVLEAAKMKRG